MMLNTFKIVKTHSKGFIREHVIYNKENLERQGNKQINMEGGQSGTYIRLTRASSGPRVSVAKRYRDENETKMNISA